MHSVKRSASVIIVSLAIATVTPATAKLAPPPPVAQRGTTVDHLYGKDIPDPYRWMEGQDNAAYNDWLKAQGVAGRAWLDASPNLEHWRQVLNAASAGSITNRTQHRVAGRIFFQRLEQGKQGVLMERLSDGTEKVLFDPNVADASGGHASITNYTVSPDSRTIAINIDHGGNEITSIEFYDTDSGAKLPDQIDNVWGEFAADWTADGKAVAYTQMTTGQADGMLNMRAKYHVMGGDAAGDKTLVAGGDNPALTVVPQEFPVVAVSQDSDWALAYATGARAEFRLCVLPKAKLLDTKPAWNCLVSYDDGIQGANIKGNALYLVSKKTTPNGELLKIDLSQPGASLATASVVVAESPEDVITSTNVARDGLYVKTMHNGVDHFERISYDTGAVKPIALPYDGASYLGDSDPFADGFMFTLQGWTQPRQLLAYDPASDSLTDLNLGANSPKDYGASVESVTAEVKSLDGTMVPITILKPKGFVPDGKTLSLLDAYGSYGTSTQPFFDPMTLEWVMAGHLYVFVDVRGGGEKGDAWRLAGKGPNKHKGVEDLIAAADFMAAQGYSRPGHIGIYGASAGGLVMGGAVTHYPSHFGAAIIHAGIVNPTRLAAAPNGANQFAEFGDPNTAEGFQALFDMDPYLAVKDGTSYPAVLLDVGLNDSRVAPWMSGKLGAALMHAGDKNVHYRTDSDSGHFGTSLSQAAAEKADHYTFLEKAMNDAKPAKTVKGRY